MPIDSITICRRCKNITCTCELEGRKTNEKDSNLATASIRRFSASRISLVIVGEKLEGVV